MNGKAHGLATKIASPVTGAVLALATGDLSLGLAAAAGCLAGLIIDPDLDCDSTLQLMNASRWRMIQLSRPLGYLWFAIWWPYGQMFPHRGISHTPLIGTLTRLVYLCIIPLAILVGMGLVGYDINPIVLDVWMFVRPRADLILYALGGLVISDILHWVMDGI